MAPTEQDDNNGSASESEGTDVAPGVRVNANGDSCKANTCQLLHGDQSKPAQSPSYEPTLQAHRSEEAAPSAPAKRKKSRASGNSRSESTSYPTPFKCSGDFCGLELRNLQDSNANNGSSTAAASRRASLPPTSALQMLFSADEIAALTEDVTHLLASAEISMRAADTELSIEAAAGESLRVITFKSIALARGNKAHLVTALATHERTKKYRDAPGDALKGTSEPNKRKKSRLLDSTAAQQLREGSRARIYGELDGVANYYRRVRVCGDCYTIYSLLDMARELAAGGVGDKKSDDTRTKQQAKHRAELEQQWAAQIDRQVAEKEKLYLRKYQSVLDNSSDSPAVTRDIDGVDLAMSSSTSSLPVLCSPKADSSGAVDTDGQLSTNGNQRNTASMPSLPRPLDKSSNLTLPALNSLPLTSPPATVTSPTTRSPIRQRIEGREKFVGVERYLRGESKRINDHTLEEGRLFREEPLTNSSNTKPTVRPTSSSRIRTTKPSGVATAVAARILLVCSDIPTLNELHHALEALQQSSSSNTPVRFTIESSSDGAHALRSAQESFYDVVLVERELAGELSGLEFTKVLRASQIQQSVTTGGNMKRPTTSAIICVTFSISKEDLQLYRECGMDGCIGKPVNHESVSRTVQAALTHLTVASSSSTTRLTGNNAIDAATEAIERAKFETQERRWQQRRRHQTRLEAANVLSMPGLADLNAREDYVHGTFQLDAATSIPYCVMGDPSLQPASANHNTFFNLVIVHDLFDTWERLQILLQSIIAKYNGAAQVLLWNYPGQAYTTWHHGALLNNDYHAQCLHALLKYVSQKGGEAGDRKRLLRDAPYYLLGIGNGGSIAMAFCTHSPPLDANTRALILVNAFSFVDAKLAQFLHDCLKVFACTPASRPDLPVYFHSRFLFSPAYLARVTTPMALNLYTAVMNPITLDGRAALCSGALAHRDLRDQLSQRGLRMPVINVCSTQDALVNANEQVEALLELGKLDVVDSIGKVLMRRSSDNGKCRRRSCVLWLASGHEVLQERKADVLLLLEQLVTGFHEVNDSPHGKSESSSTDSIASVEAGRRRASPDKTRAGGISTGEVRGSNFEDRFIDRVLTTVNQVVPAPQQSDSRRPNFSSRGSRSRPGSSSATTGDQASKWTAHQQAAAGDAAKKKATIITADTAAKPSASLSKANATAPVAWDPTTPAFERLSANVIYKIGQGSKIYPGGVPTSTSFPEVKEYMGWRVRRNQKRLQRMNQMTAVIQRAFRAFAARMLLVKIKRERCAVMLQRVWRAKIARRKYKGMKKEDWAARLLQRHWRGKLGRNSYRDKMCKYLAAVDMQRIARGWLARQLVSRIRTLRRQSAARIQREIRRFLAVRRLFAQRRRRNAAITIQRVFRGHVGRRRFDRERDKLLFSRTQSQGIAFSKQMLMEYKLFGTKLQSEVALLAREKQEVERQAEVVLKEICEFDEGIRLLESEMHSLSQVETESLSKNLDEKGKWQLREQKMRLDREFAQMLAQIAQRREALSHMEEKLTKLDRERLQKEEELKALERKLVVLLDEQQQELARIKQKQQTRSQLALDLVASGAASPLGSAFGSPSVSGQSPFAIGPLSSSSSASAALTKTSANGNGVHPAVVNSSSAFTPKQREEANSLMESTETMMKFGFMSMSMTYFSSMNMVRAMRKIGAHHMTLDNAAVVSNKRWPEYSTNGPQSVDPATGMSSMGSPFGAFQPNAPPGSFPGQQPLRIAGWSVADVGRWLDTLTLGQYKRAFADGAVDGALLLHLNDEDLKSTLGMEHRLHRKKILTSVEQMREAERVRMQKLYGGNVPDTMESPSSSSPSRISAGSFSTSSSMAADPVSSPSSSAKAISPSAVTANGPEPARENVAGANLKVVVSFAEFCQLVRHGKLKQLREALTNVPDRKFDPLTAMQPFAAGIGTVYDDLLEKSVFHINKGDENGNSPLLLAAQNNNLKVAQLLLAKGANPNHQNKSGNTAGHYAMAYSFFDLGAWLLDPDKGGCRDDIVNENGLTAYDGLS